MTEALIGALCARSSRLDVHCRRALSDVPAVTCIELTPQPAAVRGQGLSLSFKGWSPSLHAAWTLAYEPFPDGVEDEDLATDAMIALFDQVIQRQRDRAADALALGHLEPLRNGMVEHLQMDVALAAIYTQGKEERDLVEFARSAVGALHCSTTKHAGGATLGRIGQMVGESRRPDGTTIRYVAPQVKIYRDRGLPPSVFTGHHLRLHTDRLPETVLTALVGRPLRALAEVHPMLDDRPIRRADNDERPSSRSILVGLDQHLDPISTLAAA